MSEPTKANPQPPKRNNTSKTLQPNASNMMQDRIPGMKMSMDSEETKRDTASRYAAKDKKPAVGV